MKSILLTPLGKKLERVSYTALGIFILSFLIACSFFYYLTGSIGSSDPLQEITFWDSLYFSVVTFTSLGYGDLSPKGSGRIVAAIEVLIGIGSFSLFVGKIASERMSATLELLYTSENDRRIIAFSQDFSKLTEQINFGIDQLNYAEILAPTKAASRLLGAVGNYLAFHSSQGNLSPKGNASALRSIYSDLDALQLACLRCAKFEFAPKYVRPHLERTILGTGRIAKTMQPYSTSDRLVAARLKKIGLRAERFQLWEKARKLGSAKFKTIEVKPEDSPDLLNRVFQALPQKPWSNQTHKIVANQVNISKKLADKCIRLLIETGKIDWN